MSAGGRRRPGTSRSVTTIRGVAGYRQDPTGIAIRSAVSRASGAASWDRPSRASARGGRLRPNRGVGRWLRARSAGLARWRLQRRRRRLIEWRRGRRHGRTGRARAAAGPQTRSPWFIPGLRIQSFESGRRRFADFFSLVIDGAAVQARSPIPSHRFPQRNRRGDPYVLR